MKHASTALFFFIVTTLGLVHSNAIKAMVKNSPSEDQESTEQSIVITNGITHAATGKKYFGTHYPTSFKILIDDEELVKDAKREILLNNDNQVAICFSYSFLKGRYKGESEVTFEVEPGHEDYVLDFSWEKEHRLILPHAKSLGLKEIYKNHNK